MSNERPIDYCWEDFVLNGSKDAYYTLYRHYYGYLSYIGLKKKYATETVKDTINDVFLYIWEKRKSLQHINHAHNYIITAFNRSIARKARSSVVPFAELTEHENIPIENFTAPSFEDDLLNHEFRDRLSLIMKKHLSQLPARQREIIYQKFFLGLSYADIADVSKLSVNTVYNTVYATLRKLRSSIPANSVSTILSLFFANCIFFS